MESDLNAALDVDQHLETEIATPDPWRLESNPFEHERYNIMLNMVRAHGPFERGLEVGCAGGFFTELVAPYCRTLHVVDVLAAAIERASRRTRGRQGITWEVASASDPFSPGKTYDLIVVAEVLCYLPSLETLRQTVTQLAARLEPGGVLIFGSAVDETCARWGLVAGAETTMREWDRLLRRVDETKCTGAYWGENCLIAAYVRDRSATDPLVGCGVSDLREDNLVPHKAVEEIAATSVLVLAPHSDDEAFGCGGAIMHHVERGIPVRVAVVTDGAFGLIHAREEYLRQRCEESRASGKVLGYGAPDFWNLPDRTLFYGESLIERILGAIQDADLVYAPSLDEVHPDHRAVGMAAIEAVRRRGRRVKLALYEIGSPLRPNVLLNISRYAGRKQAAMACYGSQLGQRKYDEHITALNRYRTYTLPPEVTAAEAYMLVSAEELVSDPLKFHWPKDERRIADAADRALRRLLADMRNSTSWRVTAPLRALSARLRTFLHRGPPILTGPLRAILRLLRNALHRTRRGK